MIHCDSCLFAFLLYCLTRDSLFSPPIYFFTLNGGRHLVSLFRLFHPRDLPRHGDKTYVDATREVKE
jgi:hypothetical protein